MASNPRGLYRCSFCGKSQEQVHRLTAGPGGVYICNECIDLCQEIVAEEKRGRHTPPVIELHIRVDDLEQGVPSVDMHIPPDSPLFGPEPAPEAWKRLVILLTGVIRKLPPDEEG